jgi:NADP-dependent 3-hydroxy acid dehydrogenase YdfG
MIDRSKSLSKLCFISGATSGIGKAAAKLFAKKGYDIIITGRRTDILDYLSTKYAKKYGVNVLPLTFDVRDLESVKKAINGLDQGWEKIDILINNAGLAKGFHSIHEGEIDDWETMIDTNIKGLLYLTRLISPNMVKNKDGHIINVCSTAGHDVYPKGNVYSATKFAVDALTKSMRIDLLDHNIRVSQVSPGHTENTEFAKVRFNGDEKKAAIYNDFTPLNSKDVAEAIYFISSRPKHVSIQDIIITGTQQANSNFVNRSGRK